MKNNGKICNVFETLIPFHETPQGGPPPPPPLVAGMLEDCHAVGEGRKGGGKTLKAGNLWKKSFSVAWWPGGSKIEAWSLQNRGPGSAKSSLEASKTQFLKDT